MRRSMPASVAGDRFCTNTFGAGLASAWLLPATLLSFIFARSFTHCSAEVQCGGHSAANCAACPQGHGESWCNGDCMWERSTGRCIDIPFGSQDLYELLELADTAGPSEIKQAYRRLSLVHHPDKNPNADAQHFRAIRDAYEVLSNPETRVLYDTGGMQAVKNAASGNAEKGEGLQKVVELPLEVFYRGMKRTVPVRRRVICRQCRRKRDPTRCKGCIECPPTTEIVHIRHGGMIFPQQRQKPSNEDCRQDIVELEVTLEPGAFPGDRIVFANMGSQTPGEIPGDVTVVLKQQKHERGWARHGNDLVLPINLTVREALLGFDRMIRHIGGNTVQVGTSSVTRPGQLIKVAGMGMPLKGSPSQFGDLYLVASVIFPTELTEAQRVELEGVRALSDAPDMPNRQEL